MKRGRAAGGGAEAARLPVSAEPLPAQEERQAAPCEPDDSLLGVDPLGQPYERRATAIGWRHG